MSVLAALQAAGVPSGTARAHAPWAERAMQERGITSQARATVFLAQALHETGALRWLSELASGAAYEGRRDLGNVRSGDGRRYKGRGVFMLTGRANYRDYGRALNVALEASPELAARIDIAWRIAALYWQRRGLSALADRGDFLDVTRRINGGLNGLADRQRYLQLVRAVDCRPDPWAALTTRERRWVREYRALRAAHKDIARRRALRAALRRQLTRIATTARAEGWDPAHRAERYSLISGVLGI